MNKKDNKEDLKNQNSQQNNTISNILLIILICIFILSLFTSIKLIRKDQKNKLKNNKEIINITNSNISATIINNSNIEKKITESDINNKKDIIIENINTIELTSQALEKEKAILQYDVKYNILRNDFKENTAVKKATKIIVRFSYSFDNKNWNYLNNVIRTENSNISPNNLDYNITNYQGILNVNSEISIKLENNKNSKVYWKSETILKNINNKDLNKEFNAEFKIKE